MTRPKFSQLWVPQGIYESMKSLKIHIGHRVSTAREITVKSHKNDLWRTIVSFQSETIITGISTRMVLIIIVGRRNQEPLGRQSNNHQDNNI